MRKKQIESFRNYDVDAVSLLCHYSFNALSALSCPKTTWAREPKSKTAHITPIFLKKSCGVGSNALHETDARNNSPQHAASATSTLSTFFCLLFLLM